MSRRRLLAARATGCAALMDRPPKSAILKRPLERGGGYTVVPDRPGIGVELDLEVARRYPPARKEIRTPLHEDGPVAGA